MRYSEIFALSNGHFSSIRTQSKRTRRESSFVKKTKCMPVRFYVRIHPKPRSDSFLSQATRGIFEIHLCSRCGDEMETFKMAKKNRMELYFQQKPFSVLDIVCLIIGGIALIVATFVWGGGPIGFPTALSAVVVFVISRSSRVRDEEVDEALEKVLQGLYRTELNGKDPERLLKIVGYDLRIAPIVRGKDGKYRTACCAMSVFHLDGSSRDIAVYRLNLCTGDVQTEEYRLADGEAVTLVSRARQNRKRDENVVLSCFECVFGTDSGFGGRCRFCAPGGEDLRLGAVRYLNEGLFRRDASGCIVIKQKMRGVPPGGASHFCVFF